MESNPPNTNSYPTRFGTFVIFFSLWLSSFEKYLRLGIEPRIFLCLVTLELWLPDNYSFVLFLRRQKTNLIFSKKLFHSSTSHTYHHNSSWPFKQAQKYPCIEPTTLFCNDISSFISLLGDMARNFNINQMHKFD